MSELEAYVFSLQQCDLGLEEVWVLYAILTRETGQEKGTVSPSRKCGGPHGEGSGGEISKRDYR